jgi:hypothetical protein
MTKPEEIYSLQEMVTQYLETKPETRNNDKLLIYQILKRYCNVQLTWTEFSSLPPFESITRARRLIQTNRPDLRATELVQEVRRQHQTEMSSWMGR